MLCKNYYFNLKRDDDLTEKYWVRWGFSEALIEKDKKKINHEIKEEYINPTVVKKSDLFLTFWTHRNSAVSICARVVVRLK